MNDNWFEGTAVIIVNERQKDRHTHNYFLLICKNGFEIQESADKLDKQEIKRIDKLIKNRIFTIKVTPDLLSLETTNPDEKNDEYGSIVPKYTNT